ncbi:MAG TPA: LPXTG cell wall anchor domain-containing protein [Thermoleophilaceae bacterium]
MIRTLLAALLAVVALALVPASAPAQDAGSQQYNDPLAKNPSPTTNKPAAPTANTQPSAPTAARSASSGSESSSPALPRTGVDVAWLVLAGAALLGGGLALRRIAERPGA